jgi:hypothetical protein
VPEVPPDVSHAAAAATWLMPLFSPFAIGLFAPVPSGRVPASSNSTRQPYYLITYFVS